MGINPFANGFPQPQTPVTNKDESITKDFRYLLIALWNRTGAGDGVPNIQAGQTVVSGTPFNIVGDWNEFTTVPASSAIAVLPVLVPGTDCIVFNDDASHSLSVQPQPNIQIDALGNGVGYSLAAGKMQWFRCVTTTLIKSMQLG